MMIEKMVAYFLNLTLNFLKEIRQSTPLMKQQQQHHNNHHHHHHQPNAATAGNVKLNAKGEKKEVSTEMTDLKHGYAYKRSILRKLMIAQRQRFIAKKDQADLVKNNLAETSISNFSQIEQNDDEKKSQNQANNDNIK
jgi:hypothetical protein